MNQEESFFTTWAPRILSILRIVVGGLYPATVQQFQVQPSELAKEQTYLKSNIEMTRRAFNLDAIDAKYDTLISDKIEEQLRFEPGVETKNRKPLRQPAPFGAEWEIRFGPDNRFRVLYDIDEEHHAVQIVAIGEKEGNRLIVGGAVAAR